MKVVIFAGGLGTRLSEETTVLPKPMIAIAGKPILWHIMKCYSRYGLSDFIILLGYKGYTIKEYFANYYLHQNDVCFNLKDNSVEYLSSESEDWKVTLLDTGSDTLTGTRLQRARHLLSDETFFLTYGDGLSDLDMKAQIDFHRSHPGYLTMTAVQPAGRFGSFQSDNDSNKVTSFVEKPAGDGSWINGGFFICEPGIFDHIPYGENVAFEHYPLQSLATHDLLYSYYHNGFWKCMDTLRDKNELNQIAIASAPWLAPVESAHA
jgi:glucose-1-phosphate cytidylyltransferase